VRSVWHAPAAESGVLLVERAGRSKMIPLPGNSSSGGSGDGGGGGSFGSGGGGWGGGAGGGKGRGGKGGRGGTGAPGEWGARGARAAGPGAGGRRRTVHALRCANERTATHMLAVLQVGIY
jgi:hypothetical protein